MSHPQIVQAEETTPSTSLRTAERFHKSSFEYVEWDLGRRRRAER